MRGRPRTPCCAPSSCTSSRRAAMRRRSTAAARAAAPPSAKTLVTSPSSAAGSSAAGACAWMSRSVRSRLPRPASWHGSPGARSPRPPPAPTRPSCARRRRSPRSWSPPSPAGRCTPSASSVEPALIPPRGFARVAAFTDARPDHGEGGEPLQAAGVRLPGQRDLRRPRLEPRLRPARRRAQAQREGGLVAGDRHRPRRRRRPRRGGHHASAGVGGLRPPGRFHGPARRLQELQVALPRRPGRGHALSRVRRRAQRGAAIQPHVQDLRRADGGHRARGIPPPGDGAEHVRQLPECARDLALEAALRHRADRALVPQRDHPGQLPLPHTRVRADGARVLRPPGRGRAVVRLLAARAFRVVRPPRHRARSPSPAAARARRARALRQGVRRCRVRLSVRLVRARGHREPHRLRSEAAQRVQRQGPHLLRRGAARALLPLRHRAGGGRRPLDARLPGGRLRRGRGRGRGAHRAPASPAPRPLQGGRVSPPPKGRPARARAPHLRRAPRALPGRLRPGGLDRAALPPPGRGRDALRHHRRPRHHEGRHGHAARPRRDDAGSPPRGSADRGARRSHREARGVGRRQRSVARPQAKVVRPATRRTARYVYAFGAGRKDGRADMKDLLGGKGANLAEMARLGLPVPPGFTISTEVCTYYYAHGGGYPPGLKEQVPAALARVEKAVGRRFGDPEKPLLVSVRSGARASMPGMMDTILNLGLNDRTVAGLARETGNPRFAYDCYRRFVQMYGDVVLGLKPESKDEEDPFEVALQEKKRARGVTLDTELDADALRELVDEFKALIRMRKGVRFPEDPHAQLWGAIGAVFGSWMNQRAIVYRKLNNIPESWGTAVNVQAMVFGNMGADSGTGVAFTRDPATGENVFYGEFLMNAQGEDVVAGTRTPLPIAALEKENRSAYAELVRIRRTLERHYRDMMDIEFTIQQRKLYMLQCRVGQRNGLAAIRIAVDT